MLVIKIGGSLQHSDTLKHWLKLISRQSRRRLVIVPGGGAFADQVRSSQKIWGFDDVTAHSMALLAMKQMALMLHGIENTLPLAENCVAIKQQLKRRYAVIWSPAAEIMQETGIKASWDVTSDSLSVWLAQALQADGLAIVKSAPIPENFSMQHYKQTDLVDKAFSGMTENTDFAIRFYHRNDFDRFTQIELNHA